MNRPSSVMICGTPGSGILIWGTSLGFSSPAAAGHASSTPAAASNAINSALMQPPTDLSAEIEADERVPLIGVLELLVGGAEAQPPDVDDAARLVAHVGSDVVVVR